MAYVITTAGLRSLDTYAGTFQAWLNTLTLRLFQNSHVPAVDDDASDYVQASFSGYAAQPWSAWAAPTLDANNNDQFTHSPLTFSHSGGATANQIYGYYATDGAGAVVLAESNGVSGGVPMTGAGFSYSVTGNFYFGQIQPPL